VATPALHYLIGSEMRRRGPARAGGGACRDAGLIGYRWARGAGATGDCRWKLWVSSIGWLDLASREGGRFFLVCVRVGVLRTQRHTDLAHDKTK
jgi:hypothetical protein